jgi:hypothetical protein
VDRPVAKLRGDVGTGVAETGVLGKEGELAVDFFKELVRGIRVVVGDGDPDVDQIILCPGSATKARHRVRLAPGLSSALLFFPPALGLSFDRVHVLEAAGTAGEPLGPQPPQLIDIALIERAPLFPLAQCLVNHFAGGRILGCSI